MEEAGLAGDERRRCQPARNRDGDTVRVFNRRGEIDLKAQVDGAVQPGVVSAHARSGPNLDPAERNINVLTSEKLTDMGNSATFYSVLVEVELFQAAPEGEVGRQTWTLSTALPYNCRFP